MSGDAPTGMPPAAHDAEDLSTGAQPPRLPRGIRTMRKVVWSALLAWLALVLLIVLLVRFA
ncbi:MAG TPA: hypothetical protein VK425_01785 [Acidimicrobiales bacterium]|nr:hypothetical protein [Acidimicrobiales bacterium]